MLVKIKELINVIVDKIIIYKADGDDFENIYAGTTDSIPANVLEMEVRLIGAARKGVVDIQGF